MEISDAEVSCDGGSLGGGSLHRVLSGSWKSNTSVVLKERSSHFEAQREAHLLARCCHPNVISCVGFLRHMVIMKRTYPCGSGLMHALSTSPTQLLLRHSGLQIAVDIAHALAFIHMKTGCPHLGVKPSNILIDSSLCHATLTGFSSSPHARSSQSHAPVNAHDSEAAFAAPEVMNGGDKPSTKADVYSFGVVLQVLAEHKLPQTVAPDSRSRPVRGKLDAPVPVKLQKLVYPECCSHEPSNRMDMEYVVRRLDLLFLTSTEPISCESTPTRASCDEDIPERFICPLSHHVMRDPCFIDSGRTFDRVWIQRHMQQYGTDPITNEPLLSLVLRPNLLLRSEVQEWFARRGRKHELQADSASPLLPNSSESERRRFSRHRAETTSDERAYFPDQSQQSVARGAGLPNVSPETARRFAEQQCSRHVQERVETILGGTARKTRLVGHSIGPHGAKSLAYALQHNSSLVTLNIKRV